MNIIQETNQLIQFLNTNQDQKQQKTILNLIFKIHQIKLIRIDARKTRQKISKFKFLWKKQKTKSDNLKQKVNSLKQIN